MVRVPARGQVSIGFEPCLLGGGGGQGVAAQAVSESLITACSTRSASTCIIIIIIVMPECYCGPCGVIHAVLVNDNCQRAASNRQSMHSRTMQGESASVKQEKNLAGKPVESMSDSGDEEALRAKISEMERKKPLAELKSCHDPLKEEMDRLSIGHSEA